MQYNKLKKLVDKIRTKKTQNHAAFIGIHLPGKSNIVKTSDTIETTTYIILQQISIRHPGTTVTLLIDYDFFLDTNTHTSAATYTDLASV